MFKKQLLIISYKIHKIADYTDSINSVYKLKIEA